MEDMIKMQAYNETIEELKKHSEAYLAYKIDGGFASAVAKAVALLEARVAEDISVPIKIGKWVDSQPDLPDYLYKKSGMSYYCSCCGHHAGKFKHKTYKFCPWCGAKMMSEDEKR